MWEPAHDQNVDIPKKKKKIPRLKIKGHEKQQFYMIQILLGFI